MIPPSVIFIPQIAFSSFTELLAIFSISNSAFTTNSNWKSYSAILPYYFYLKYFTLLLINYSHRNLYTHSHTAGGLPRQLV